MINYGIAKVNVQITEALPKVNRYPTMPFLDISAASMPSLNNTDLPPVLIQYVSNSNNCLNVCFPSRRQMMINNYIDDGRIAPPYKESGEVDPSKIAPKNSDGEPIPYILWKPVMNDMPIKTSLSGGTVNGVEVKGLISDKEVFPDYNFGDKKAPKWSQQQIPYDPPPDDLKIVGSIYPAIFETEADYYEDKNFSDKKNINVVSQDTVQTGLWWGIESSTFLDTNTPFSINIKKHSAPPPKDDTCETFILIALGCGSSNGDERLDLVLSMNNRPKIIDYKGTGGDKNTNPPTITELPSESFKIPEGETDIEISFMTIAGRLIIYVNANDPYIYTRAPKDVQNAPFMKFDIPSGAIRVYASNISATIRAAPMSFAPIGFIFVTLQDLDSVTKLNKSGASLTYKAINSEGDITNNPICVLPKSSADLSGGSGFNLHYGVDCDSFNQIDDSKKMTIGKDAGFGFHGQGEIEFIKKPNSIKSNASNGSGDNREDVTPDTAIFAIVMYSKTVNFPGFGSQFKYRGGCPYFFRIKGHAELKQEMSEGDIKDVSEDVLSVEESTSAPDWFHIKKSVTITLYNKKGVYDYCKKKQKGVIVSWGWNDKIQRTFTGLTTVISSSETPGKETITLQCEDYIYILQNSKMINSPIYDGMIGCYAIKDLVKRAGIGYGTGDFVLDSELSAEPERYALPSGYSFSNPVMRFQDYSNIFENVVNVAQRGTMYFYFDEIGRFHIEKIPGGMRGYGSDYSVPENNQFSSDPKSKKPVILGERNIEVAFTETQNNISGLTVHRDTRATIIYGITAGTNGFPEDLLLFRRTDFQDQPAWGSYDVMAAEINDQAKRLFTPTRSINFKIVGMASTPTVLMPLEYISVDGVPFRLISIKRSYNADSNDFTQSYEGEWLGGA